MTRPPAKPPSESSLDDSHANADRIGASRIGQLLDAHGAALALFAAQWTADADDCVQEALIEFARQSTPPESPVAWLYRVVKRRALNRARGERRRREHERRWLRERLVAGHGDSPTCESLELTDLLDTLDDTHREVVVLKLWGGLTFAQIGQAIETSTATAQRRYEQAISKLQVLWNKPVPHAFR